MALNNLGLGFLLTAKDLASGVIGQVRNGVVQLQVTSQNASNNMSTMFRGMAQGAILAGSGFVGLKASMGLATASGEFTREMEFVRKATSANADEFKAMHDASLMLSRDMPVNAMEAAQSLYTIGQAGFDARQTLDLLRPVQTLKTLSHGELDAAKSAGILSAAMRIWGKDATEATKISDVLSATVNSTRMDFKDLPLMLAGAARGTAAAGFEMEDAMLAMGMIRNVIPTAERAGTAFGTFAERLNDTKSAALLAAKGINVVDASGKQKRSAGDIIKDLVAKTSAMGEHESQKFMQDVFKTRASAGINALMLQFRRGRRDEGVFRKGSELWAYMETKVKTQGASAAFLAAATQNYAGSIDKLKASWDTAKVAFGEPFEDVWSPIIRGITRTINFLQDAWMAMPMPLRRFLAAVFTAASALVFVAGAVKLLTIGFALLKIVMGALQITAFGLTLSLLPMIGIFMIIGGVIAAFAVASNHNLGGIGSGFSELTGKVTLFWQVLSQLFAKNGRIEKGFFDKYFSTPKNAGVLQFAITVWHWIGRIGEAVEGFSNGFHATLDRLGPVFKKLGTAFSRLGEALGLGGHNVSENREAWAAWYRVGYFIGEFIGFLASLFITVLSYAISFCTGVVYTFRVAFAILGIIAKVVYAIFNLVANAVMWVTEQFGYASDGADVANIAFTALGMLMGVKMVEQAALWVISLVKIQFALMATGWAAVKAGVMATLAWLPFSVIAWAIVIVLVLVAALFGALIGLSPVVGEALGGAADYALDRFMLFYMGVRNIALDLVDIWDEAVDAISLDMAKISVLNPFGEQGKAENEQAIIADQMRRRAKAKAGREKELVDLAQRVYTPEARATTRSGQRLAQANARSLEAQSLLPQSGADRNQVRSSVEDIMSTLPNAIAGAKESTEKTSTGMRDQMTVAEFLAGLKNIPGTTPGMITKSDLESTNNKLVNQLAATIGTISVYLDGDKVGNASAAQQSRQKGLAFGAGPKAGE